MDSEDRNKGGRTRSFGSDTRGMSGAAIGMLFAVVVVVSAVTVGVAAPAESSGGGHSQEQVDTVAVGMQSSLADVNDPSTSSAASTSVKSKMSASAWENIPPAVRSKLQTHVGSYVAQMEAQGRQSGHVTRIEPAYGTDGVTLGAHLRQDGSGTHTATREVTEQYTVQETETVRKQTGTKEVPVYETYTVTKTRQNGTKTIVQMERVRQTVPIYDTKQVPRTVTYTEMVRVKHTERVFVKDCGLSWGTMACDLGLMGHYETRTTYTWEKRLVRETVWEEIRYIDHYETKVRWDKVTRQVPVYETYNVTKTRQNGTRTVPTYEMVDVTRDVTKTRTVTKQVPVSNALFTYEGNANWTLAHDVDGARRASMTVTRDSLATSKDEAMTFRAVDTSGQTWSTSVWRDGETVVVETSTGIHHEVDASSVTIDFAAGTVAGEDVGLTLAAGLDESYDLQFRNGDNAKGTYEFVIAGTSAVTEKEGITVEGDIIYEAVFDITYSNQDTTYTDQVTITPPVDDS